jgi:HD-GYP domain-containing protein (c-di-GMP phosphodiesterase class II)
MNSNKTKLPLAAAISISFTIVLFITGSLIGWFNYIGMKQILLTSTSDVIKRAGKNTVSELLRVYDPVEGFVESLSFHPITEAKTTQERLSYLSFLRSGLKTGTAMSAIYIGYEDGSFFLLRVISPTYKPNFSIPEGSKYLAQTIEVVPGKENKILFYFFDEELKEISTLIPESYDYDPRTRDWYTIASSKDSSIRTDPYVFFTTGEVGKTFAIKSEKNSVIGADVALKTISESLVSQKITPSTQIILIDSDKNAIAYLDPEKLILKGSEPKKVKLAHLNELGISILNNIEKGFELNKFKNNYMLENENINWMVYSASIPVRGEEPNYLIIASPEEELLEEAKTSLNKTLLITLGLLLITLPIIFFVSRAISKSMKHLIHLTNGIRDFDFSGEVPKESRIKELNELSSTVGIMKTTIQKFLEISSLLTGEKDFNILMYHILSETATSANTNGGILYILSEDEKFLMPGAIYLNDGSAIPIDEVQNISLEKDSDSFPLGKMVKEDKTSVVRIPSLAFSNELGFFGTERESELAYMIGIPLKNQDRFLIGYLCLFEAKDSSQNKGLLSFVENLSGTSSVAVENHRLLESQKKLFDSFIRLIASSIDSKFSYHNGHCSRVPELAMMLAEAVADQENGVFSDFSMNADEKEALHIASWLHDCGKIMTPQFVVEKSTKLETVYDRLNEIRTRFEVIKRDIIISYYKKLTTGISKENLDKELERDLQAIDSDFEFIASCNTNDKELTYDDIEKIRKIGLRTWEKTLDDTIGLSRDEKAKKAKRKKGTLSLENIISDRPEHYIERDETEMIPAENPWGFKVRIPRNKFNKGELYNLSIEKGVWNEEEKYIINSHMISTIRMLETLPFPKTLGNIPEIAGGHHEKMDGSGFPKKLSKQDMSVMARIMGISDLFESLTSVNDPYTKGKTLSESIQIMDRMRKENHIDGDLFEIFLTSGIYNDYAEKFLQPYQRDSVDISKYVN